MSDLQDSNGILQDFLIEATELLSGVDNKLVELEKFPADHGLLNDIFRGFHTIKGGAGFLEATAMVELCHLTESLFDKLRSGSLRLSPELMDVIMEATGSVRAMLETMNSAQQPQPALPQLLAQLRAANAGTVAAPAASATPITPTIPATLAVVVTPQPAVVGEPDWQQLHAALTGNTDKVNEADVSGKSVVPAPSCGRRASDNPATEVAHNGNGNGNGRRESDKIAATKESTIRVDTARLDQVLNLSGEIGLTKNRLNRLRAEVMQGKKDIDTLRALDATVSQLDLLVSDLQSAVMKTRMQPIGRLFQKYPRMVRDLARSLGKNIELELIGEDTELDRSMIDDLSDPLVHLVRNAVDHGVESPDERRTAGKTEKSILRLSAVQAGDHIIIEIRDDGRGMRPDVLRRKAVEKGVIDVETANSMDDQQALKLIFMPGFSTKDEVSSVSGRGVGMDVVKTNIQKLNGRIDIHSVPGDGTTLSIFLPLTLAILPVLVVRHGLQPFAVPLAMVHEIVRLDPAAVQLVSGRGTLVVRGEVLPVRSLAGLLGWPLQGVPRYGVLMQSAAHTFILAVDSYVGRDDVIIKPLADIKPKGIAGATLSSDGLVVLVLDIEELLAASGAETASAIFALAA